MEATWAALVDTAVALAHAMVVPEDLASVHHAEATDLASDPLVAAMVAQAHKRSMAALVAAPRAAMAAPRAAPVAAGAVAEVAMAALRVVPAAAPAVTEDGEQANKMKKATDKIVNAINKMV